MELQAFLIILTDPRTGPRGGRAPDSVQKYVVTAASAEEARQLFDAELASQVTETTSVWIGPCGCRVMGTR
jgi:hypothetical protein